MDGATGFVRGFLLPIEAASFLLRNQRIKRVAVLPLIASIILYGLAFGVTFWLVWNWEISVGTWEFWGGFGAWLSGALDFVLNTLKWIVTIPAMFVVGYYTFTAFGTVIAAPFNDMLSARVELRLCDPQEEAKLGVIGATRAAAASMWDAIKIVLRQAMWTLLVLPLIFIPFVGFLPLLLVSSWFSGLGFVDVAMARNNLRNRHKGPLLTKHRAEVMGFGLATYIIFLIPFGGLLLLPIAVTAGTMMYCRWDWEQTLAELQIELPKGFKPPHLTGKASHP